MSRLPTGTVTFIFTDIEGSTRLLQTLGDRYSAALAQHRALLRDAFSSHRGVEVDTQGDAFFVAFPTPQGALQAAVKAQRALADHPWPEQIELRVRMGIHTGTPEVSEQGYVGADVHLGARICAAAWGGQILVSPTTAAHLSSALDDVTLRALGSHALKDIEERVELYQVVAPGLRQDFPPLRTPSSSHPTNLPTRPSPLIGRDPEIATVTELLGREDVSLVTLVGPGGTGKTRLALATGAELLPSFGDGVFFVDLSALTDPSLVVPQIAHTLSLRETPGRSLTDVLTDHLSAKQALLILDNLEQVIDAATDITTILTGAPDLKALATSRESLRIAGEKELPLAPLSLPRPSDPPEDIAASPAVELFVARAQDVRPDFIFTSADASTVAEVCRRLDGLPLAIELAAARVKVLSLPALNERLEQGLKVLTSGRRDASERQRTLKGAIAWSYDLLSPDEQNLFRRLGVFAGGFTLEAAEAVCDRGDLNLDVLDGLASLVDKSLMGTDEHRERFSLLETIREFAQEKLEETEEAEDIRRAHAEFFGGLAEEAQPHLIGRHQKHWLDRLEQEHDNLRAALHWVLAKDPALAGSIAAHMYRFWYVRGYLSEGRRWLELVLKSAVPIRHAVTVATMLGMFAYVQSDFDEARSASLRGMALATEAGDERGVLRCTETLALCAMEQGEYAEARTHFEKILEGFHTLHEERSVAVTIANLGALCVFENDYYKASELANESLRRFRNLDDKEGMAGVFVVLGLNEILLGDSTSATPYLKEALDVAAHLRHPELIASALNGLAASAVASGDAGRGAVLMGGANRVRTESGVALDPLEHRIQDDARTRLRQLLGETKLDEMFEKGRVMTIGELVRCAASDGTPPSTD
jgi:predicted ATPase/class 3 adenylate cyclase